MSWRQLKTKHEKPLQFMHGYPKKNIYYIMEQLNNCQLYMGTPLYGYVIGVKIGGPAKCWFPSDFRSIAICPTFKRVPCEPQNEQRSLTHRARLCRTESFALLRCLMASKTNSLPLGGHGGNLGMSFFRRPPKWRLVLWFPFNSKKKRYQLPKG